MARVEDVAPPGWMVALEAALCEVASAVTLLTGDLQPPQDLSEPARALERALGAIYDAFDGRAELSRALGSAADELKTALVGIRHEAMPRPQANAVGALERALVALSGAQGLITRVHPQVGGAASEELQASGSIPRLHDVPRSSLVPTISTMAPQPPEPAAPEPLPPPASFEALHETIRELKARANARVESRGENAALLTGEEAEVSTGGLTGASFANCAISERAFVEARTRDLLEEVAMVGIQRWPLPGDHWRTISFLDDRMLRSIDAIASLGPQALASLEPLVRAAPSKDPARLFALAMTLGCMRGRDALGVVERVFNDFEVADPACAGAMATAFKLAPHNLLPLVLRSFLGAADPRRRALAIDVLGYRGAATYDELLTAAKDVPIVACKALPHLAVSGQPGLVDAIELAIQGDDLGLRRAAWLAMALSGDPQARPTLAAALTGDAGDEAALLLALVADERDASLLLEHTIDLPTVGGVAALGWGGAATAIPALVTLLEHEDAPVAAMSARALERITGAGLSEDVEVMAEDVLVPAPPEPDLGEPAPLTLRHAVSDPRDLPPEPASETISRPSTDPERWEIWWRAQRDDFRAGGRYRRGRPHSLRVCLWELDQGAATLEERCWLQHELVIRSGRWVKFHAHDFVLVQEQALRQWAAVVAEVSPTTGRWGRAIPAFGSPVTG